ncbi:hypothetical protein ACHAW5_000167 [Stephanodiscus triporus]|uniref:Uncharacterized protein n=1 Tax=Stephanodiscus triporus TaxID=2934178 RepID=A0ABD3P7F6_9STRA
MTYLIDDSSPSPQTDAAIPTVIPAAIPTAEPVERGRFVLHVHNRDEDSLDGNRSASGDDDDGAPNSPASPKSFDSDEIFEDVLQVEEQTSDRDLESLFGPLPSRRSCNTTPSSLETDRHGNDDEGDPRRKKQKKFTCPCCPNALRRGPCHALAAVMRKDGSAPSTGVGNMIVVFPKCFNSMGFGIVGPHWFGPVCCLFLLTGATSYYIPKALIIGQFSAMTCLLFYIVSVVSLFVVSCSDPGVVRAGGLDVGGGRHCYAGVPTTNMTAGRGWRFCDLCR